MYKLPLDGLWKVSYVQYNSKIDSILDSCFVPEGWLDAQVPEDIHMTLRRAGYLKGHFYGKDPEEERWIEEVDWVYFKEFFAADDLEQDKAVLDFEGLDTFCDIYLNGEKIAFSDNMFTPLSIDVKSKLRFNARNVLVVRFYSPVKFVENTDTTGLFTTTTMDRILARKAQMNYSWDFCGRCVTTGIWKSVSIKSYNHNHIEDYYIYTDRIEGGNAVVGLEINLNSEIEPLSNYEITTELSLDGNVVFNKQIPAVTIASNNSISLALLIENPRLWWPRPYGAPTLYDFRLTLAKDGQTVDTAGQRFGIRTVEIIQEPQDDDGTSYIFKVNGKRLFIRGANWVPINVVYTDINDHEYEELLDYAAEGNITMLRIWGGGIYEPLRFFELCDEKGIMVMHDFMFACGIYPRTREFLENAYNEAVYNTKKYRNCTSLVLWSGDNENDEAYTWAGRPTEYTNDTLNKVTIKSACEKYDPHRKYIHSSPHSPFDDRPGGNNPKSDLQGDTHLYVDYKTINNYRPRFLSEFGGVSLPEKDTYFKFNFLRKDLDKPAWLENRFPYIISAAESSKLPESAESSANGNSYSIGFSHDKLIYTMQEFNSYELKYWIERLRMLKWYCAGSMYWKFNDPIADNNKGNLFPTLMAAVDFYKKPKMTFYYTKRAYEDNILAFHKEGDKLEVYSCSESEHSYSGTLTVRHMDFSGHIYSEKTADCVLAPDSSALLYTVDLGSLGINDEYSGYIKVSFSGEEKQNQDLSLNHNQGQSNEQCRIIEIENRYFLVGLEDFHKLRFGDSGLLIKNIVMKDNALTVTLSTENFARNVRLNILDIKAYYSDNYFDMDAFTEKTVTLKFCNDEMIHDKLLYIEVAGEKQLSCPLDRV